MTSLNRNRKYLPNEERDEFDELYRRLNLAHEQIAELNRQMGKRQHPLHWREPEWENGFDQVSEASELEPFGYRWASSKYPIFKGHIDVENASSGDVAFFLDADGTDEDLYLPYHVRDHIILSDNDGASFISGMIILNAFSLNVSIVWPAS